MYTTTTKTWRKGQTNFFRCCSQATPGSVRACIALALAEGRGEEYLANRGWPAEAIRAVGVRDAHTFFGCRYIVALAERLAASINPDTVDEGFWWAEGEGEVWSWYSVGSQDPNNDPNDGPVGPPLTVYKDGDTA